jgi:hypothetical protein
MNHVTKRGPLRTFRRTAHSGRGRCVPNEASALASHPTADHSEAKSTARAARGETGEAFNRVAEVAARSAITGETQ